MLSYIKIVKYSVLCVGTHIMLVKNKIDVQFMCVKIIYYRFLFDQSISNVVKSDFTILKPMFHLQTLTYEDIQTVIDKFKEKFLTDTTRQYAVVSGDFQVWSKLWFLRARHPDEYKWVIPIPGEWHYEWHVLQGIYRMYYHSLLLPFSKVLNFSSLDPAAKNFHYAEDFLQMITIAIWSWIDACLKNHPRLTVMQWLHKIRRNKNAYELAYACIHYFIPYWVLRSAIKWNRHKDVQLMWRYWIHLFIATNKYNYVGMSIRFLFIMRSLHPQVRALINKHRVMSYTGDPGTGIPLDGLIEMVCNI